MQLGFAHTVLADDANGVYAFSRDLDHDHICVVVNRSDQERTERLKFGPGDRNVALMDWLDAADARLDDSSPQQPDGRPTITAIDGAAPAAMARHGVVSVSLRPWGAMILSERDVMTTH
jgi:hypothetical protein